MSDARITLILLTAAASLIAAAPHAVAQKGPPQQAQPAQSAPAAQARPGESPLQQVTRLNAEGAAAYQRRDYEAAVRAFDEAVVIYARVAGASDPRTAMAAVNLGNAMIGAGRYSDAQEVLELAEGLLVDLGYGEETLAPIRRAISIARDQQARASAGAGGGAATGSRPAQGGSDPLLALNERGAGQVRAGELDAAETSFLEVLSGLEAAGRASEELSGIAWTNLGDVYLQQARLEEAVNAIERARAIFAVLDPNHRYLAVVDNNLAAVRRRQGDSSQALAGYQSAYESMAASFGQTHPNTLSALGNYANALDGAGRGAEALSLLEPALAAFAAAGEPDTPVVALLKSNLAEIYLQQGRWSEAAALNGEAVGVLGTHPDASLRETAQIRRRYGRALTLAGRPAEAEPVLAQAVTEAGQVFGAAAEETIMAQSMLASAIFDQARFSEAEGLQRAALSAAQALSVEGENTMAAAIESNLAGTLRMQGRYADAEALYRRSLVTAEAGEDAVSTAVSLENLAGAVRIQGRLEEAAQLQVRAIGLYEGAYGPEHPETIRAYGNAGTTLGLAGDHGESERLLRLGLEGLERQLPDRHVMVLVARSNLAWLYLRHMDRPAEALALYRTATGSIVDAAYDDAALDDAAGAAVVRRRADIFTLHVEAAWAASHD